MVELNQLSEVKHGNFSLDSKNFNVLTHALVTLTTQLQRKEQRFMKLKRMNMKFIKTNGLLLHLSKNQKIQVLGI
jgi:hypothetical protein